MTEAEVLYLFFVGIIFLAIILLVVGCSLKSLINGLNKDLELEKVKNYINANAIVRDRECNEIEKHAHIVKIGKNNKIIIDLL